jgi:hypothetical protein
VALANDDEGPWNVLEIEIVSELGSQFRKLEENFDALSLREVNFLSNSFSLLMWIV